MTCIGTVGGLNVSRHSYRIDSTHNSQRMTQLCPKYKFFLQLNVNFEDLPPFHQVVEIISVHWSSYEELSWNQVAMETAGLENVSVLGPWHMHLSIFSFCPLPLSALADLSLLSLCHMGRQRSYSAPSLPGWGPRIFKSLPRAPSSSVVLSQGSFFL